MSVRFVSLFSGIGGLDIGLEKAGMVCAVQVEIDPFCQKVLQKNFPNAIIEGDIRGVNWNAYKEIKVICGGFPCQPVSEAGKRKAQDDERWLWPEFIRAIRAIRPRYILVENVSGLLNRGMGDVLGSLAECGYDAEWQMLTAQAFGAPHRRERVFIVAYPASLGLEAPHIFNRAALQAWTKESRQTYWGDRRLALSDRNELFAFPHAGIVSLVDGVQPRLDEFRAIGNAVVPAISEWIGNQIMEKLKCECS